MLTKKQLNFYNQNKYIMVLKCCLYDIRGVSDFFFAESAMHWFLKILKIAKKIVKNG